MNEIFEKVNPGHPDKIADRIAGAILDLANTENPEFIAAVEVLIGHDKCLIINETNTKLQKEDIDSIVTRIAGPIQNIEYQEVSQDEHLAANQKETSCGDNGIFVGTKTSPIEQLLTNIAGAIYDEIPYDGKYIIDTEKKIITICQSNATNEQILNIVQPILADYVQKYDIIINPLGPWTGGTTVDSGATNRKLGSDMARAVSGGGLHGKDTSKADLSLNFWCHYQTNKYGITDNIKLSCSIGDKTIIYDGKQYNYKDIVNFTKNEIKNIGGYEKFAEWGLVRPKNNIN